MSKPVEVLKHHVTGAIERGEKEAIEAKIESTESAPKVEVPKKEVQTQVLVPVNDRGSFDFKNQLELRNAASMLIRTGLAPEHLRNEGAEAVAAALVLCKQFNLPQKAMNQMAFVKGRLTCYGSLVTALAERHKMYGEKREFFVDENSEEICAKNKNLFAQPKAAVVQIKKKDQEHWSEYFFTVDDAKMAGLDAPKKRSGDLNTDSPWIKYQRDMLMHKARARALKAEYASSLEGIDYHDDIVEAYQGLKDVTPKRNDKETTKQAAENLERELFE